MSDQPTWGDGHWDREGLDVDALAHDNPVEAMRIGLECDDRQRVLGAYRLLQASGREPGLPYTQTVKLAGFLEQAGMYLEAARTYRRAAEIDLKNPDSPHLMFRCAGLLLGPTARVQPAIGMLRYLVESYPDHRVTPHARSLLKQIENQDTAGLIERFVLAVQELGGEVDWQQPLRGASAVSTFHAGFKDDSGLRGGMGRQSFDPRTTWLLGIVKRLYVVFLVLLLIYGVTIFTRNRYRSIEQIDPALWRSPLQTKIKQKNVRLTYEGHHYNLVPRFDYEINGLVVSRDDYTLMGLSRGNLFHLDLCMIFGNNVKSRAYRHSGLSFVHHGNVCYATSRGGVPFDFKSLSNTHLLAANEELRDRLEEVEVGDQVRLKGWLVDVSAVPVKSPGSFIPSAIRLKTSTTRTDTGLGACEILYLRGIEILAEGNVLSRRINAISFGLLLVLALIFILRLIFLPLGYKNR